MKRLSRFLVAGMLIGIRAIIGQPKHIRTSVKEAKRLLQILRDQGTRIPEGVCVKPGLHAASIRLGLDHTYPRHRIDFLAHTYKGEIFLHAIEPHSPPGGRQWECSRYFVPPQDGVKCLEHCFQQLTF